MTKREHYILIATILGSGIATLDGTVVNIALPTIANNLHTDYSGLQWIVDGYLLTLSALIILGGSLGDIFGQKRVFQLGVIGFGITSLLCGIAPNITALTLSRLLQGIAGALLVPSSLAVINTNIAPERRARAIGTWTAMGAIFIAIGPFAGGLLVALSWRLIFLINLPIAIACLLFIRSIADPVLAKRRSVDVIGALLAVGALAGTTYALIEEPAHGWHPLTISTMTIGVIAAIIFILYERKIPNPMLPLSLFHSRNFTGANLTTLGMYAALGGALFSLTLYLQTALGFSPLAAGLAFFPVTIMMFLLAGRAGGLSAQYGPRFFMTTGPIVIGLGFLLMLQISPAHSNYLLYILPAAIVFGAGLVIAVAPLTATVMSSIDERHSGIASAVNNAVARLAGLLIVAFLGIIVGSQTTHALGSSQTSLDQKSINVVNKAIAGGLHPAMLSDLPSKDQSTVTQTVKKAQRGVFTSSILINSLLAIGSGLIAFVFIRNPKKPLASRQPE